MQTAPTGGAKFAESGGVTPRDGLASGTKLDTGKSGHIIAQYRFIELDRVGQGRCRQVAVAVETLGKFLEEGISWLGTP